MTPNMDFQDLPHFKPKKRKLLAAILFVIEEASKARVKLTIGEIAKTLFIADDSHFGKYGRPVTFDNYVAMKNGPVGDLAWDVLNDRPNVSWADFDLARAPWTKEASERRVYFYPAAVLADRRKLSPSDIDELRAALAHVTSVGFGSVSHETHQHPAWIAAWSRKDGQSRAAAMDWRDFPLAEADSVSDLVMASWNAS